MRTYIIKRVLQALITILGVTIVVFLLIRITGDPVSAMMPPEATKEEYEVMRQFLGLDRPIHIQYWTYLMGILKGDFGESIRFNEPALDVFLMKFPNTLQLATAAMAISILIGVPLGIMSAVKVGSWFDSVGKVFALMGQAIPVFWLGLMLILVLSVQLELLPVSGMGGWQNLVMPAFTLGWGFSAALLRLTRSAMLDVMDNEYIKMARTVGVPEMSIIFKQALKNALIPIVTLGTMNFIFLISGTVITETIFAWPGVGRLVVESITARDFPMIQMAVLIFAFIFVFANLFLDILYAFLDPRIRYQ